MQEDEEDRTEEERLNIDVSGRRAREVDEGATLEFVTILEIIALLVGRLTQLNDYNSPHSTVDERAVKKLGPGAGLYHLLLAELSDPTIEYPVLVPRGSGTKEKACRVHADLAVREADIDMFVLPDDEGKVSYNSVNEELDKNPCAPSISMERDIKRIRDMMESLQCGVRI